jgi:cytochrome b pre-mRNA-processing protein 3
MKGPARVLTWLYRRLLPRTDDRAALRPLWQRVVGLAREPQWYAKGGLADTKAGRFDAITLVLGLVLLRMEREPDLIAPSARLTELFISDMEGQLREGGMGDPTVGKQIGKLMGVLAGRTGALRDGLVAEDPAVLVGAVARNASLIEGADPALIAAELRVIAAQLEGLEAARLLSGEIER